MVNIFLRDHNTYPWTIRDGVSFRGYFIVDKTYYSADSAISYLQNHLLGDNLETELSKLNGVFSLILEQEESVLFSVDRLRSLPLFYHVTEDGSLLISDEAQTIKQHMSAPKIDLVSAQEYHDTGLFVTGPYTLVSNLYQVQAAECCQYGRAHRCIDHLFYFEYRHENFYPEDDQDAIISAFHDAYAQTGKKLVQALHGRTAVVPLSGGADSRMVLSMLKAEHYDKVICFTYGSPGNEESVISKQVAESYGYPWHFVPYSKDLWKSLRNAPIIKEYFNLAFQYTSTPHLQDFPAVCSLKEQGLIPSDSVFVPGHSGDLIAGSNITPEYMNPPLSRNTFMQMLSLSFYKGKISPVYYDRISDRFPRCSDTALEEMASQSEWFNIQERQAKFIVNSVRVYEFFGYEWLLPLWDNNLFAFWSRVPIAARFRRRLYFEAIGEDHISSTNDPKLMRSVSACIRKIPILRDIPRRAFRVARYFQSPSRFETFIPFLPYLRACLFYSSPIVHVNDLISWQLLKQVHEESEFETR